MVVWGVGHGRGVDDEEDDEDDDAEDEDEDEYVGRRRKEPSQQSPRRTEPPRSLLAAAQASSAAQPLPARGCGGPGRRRGCARGRASPPRPPGRCAAVPTLFGVGGWVGGWAIERSERRVRLG